MGVSYLPYMQMSEKQLRPLHIRQMRGRVQKPRLSQGKELQVMKKPRLTTIFSMILIFAGISLALYPTISNILAQKHASQAITEYNDEIKDMDEEKIDAVKEAMQQYNEQLGNAVTQDAIGEQQTGTSHVDMLDIGDVIGYLTVPVINVNLPIYKGTSQDVLAKGVGYVPETSFPLGGESTHSVLTGHRGLPDAKLFTDMDKVQKKDQFYIHVLDEVLAYEVDQIKVVDPEDTSGSGYCGRKGLCDACHLHTVCCQYTPPSCERTPCAVYRGGEGKNSFADPPGGNGEASGRCMAMVPVYDGRCGSDRRCDHFTDPHKEAP